MVDDRSLLVVIGSGDHARVVLDCLRAAGRPVWGLVDAEPSADDVRPAGLPVHGDLTNPLWRDGIGSAHFIVAIGSNEVRERAYQRALRLGLMPETVVHPTAVLLGGCEIGPGSQVCAGAVIGVDARVGANVIVNTGATIDHDNIIGDHVSVGPGAHLAGRVTVGPFSHIGLAASVIEGIAIGSHCLVAAGATVVRPLSDRSRVAGVPARPMEPTEKVLKESHDEG